MNNLLYNIIFVISYILIYIVFKNNDEKNINKKNFFKYRDLSYNRLSNPTSPEINEFTSKIEL